VVAHPRALLWVWLLMIPGCPRGQDAPDADAPPTWVRVNAEGALVDEAAPAPARGAFVDVEVVGNPNPDAATLDSCP
jgi:hypothetical protein